MKRIIALPLALFLLLPVGCAEHRTPKNPTTEETFAEEADPSVAVGENQENQENKNDVEENNTMQDQNQKTEEAVLFGMTQSEADLAFGDLLDGLFTGKSREMIVDLNIGSDFGFHFPDMLYVDGEYWGYYITYATETGKGGVGLAISSDGKNWDNKGCVIQPDRDWDRNGAYFAGVWRDTDGKIYLVYECKGDENTKYGTLENIALATSDDGVNWEKEGVILYKDLLSSWQCANVGTPDLYKTGDTWYMTFHGFNYVDCQIGVAYGTDLHDLTVVKDPVIPTVQRTPYSGTTGRRDVIFVDGWYYMVYEISTDQVEGYSYGGARWNHMFARSRDMISWEITEGPMLNHDTIGFGYDGPCWMVIDGELYVYSREVGHNTMAIKIVPRETEK